MKFVCRNEKCSRFGVEDEYLSNVYRRNADGELVSVNAPCPECGCLREEVNADADIPISQKNLEFGKYASASKEEKTRMLQQRSHEHFEKHIKGYKDNQISEAVKQFNQK